MAGRFLTLEEAAVQLGISPEKLKELAADGVVRGFRDGPSLKFKSEEVDRAKAEMPTDGGGLDDLDLDEGDDLLSFDDDLNVVDVDADIGDGDESDSSILVSEVELGHSDETTSSTIIGRVLDERSADSDLSLGATGSKLTLDEPGQGSSNVSLEPNPNKKSSDVTLVPGSSIDSDVALVADGTGSDLNPTASKVGIDSGLSLHDFDAEDASTPDSQIQVAKEPSDVNLLGGGSDVLSGSSNKLVGPLDGGTGDLMPSGGSGDLSLGSGDLAGSGDLLGGSGALGFGSELALGEEDDDDLVLGGGGSDVSLSAIDSGINLTSPADSGISLEDDDALDLGGSSISSLELPEDDDEIIALDVDMADQDETTQLRQDEEFLLAPSDQMIEDESDSGSQVIALEDSEAFDEDAATMVQNAAAAGAAMFQPAGDAGGGSAQAQPQVITVPIEVVETPYSVWNVLGLLATTMVLSICGMLMMDVVRNIWSWNGASQTTSSIMEMLLDAFKL